MHKILANTLFLGKEVLHLPECHSTNDVALQKYRNKEIYEGSIIITDKQTAGRGQRGNTWESEIGQNLTFSLVLTPHFLDPRAQFNLNIAISLAIQEALMRFATNIQIKWPNDIVHSSLGKIGGILIESTIGGRGLEVSIVGIGLNINQTNFSFPKACSLANICGYMLNRNDILEAVITRIEYNYLFLQQDGAGALRNRYLKNLFQLKEWSTYDDGKIFRGKILGITEEGRLIVEKANGPINLYAFKDVRFL